MKIRANKNITLDVIYTQTCGEGCCSWIQDDFLDLCDGEILDIGNADRMGECEIASHGKEDNDGDYSPFRVNHWLIVDYLEDGIFTEVE